MIRLLPLLSLAATAEAACSVAGRSNPKLRRGDETYLCVVLSSSLDWAEDTKYVRLGFRAEVDTFARLEVRGAWAPLTTSTGAHHALNGTSIGLSLQSEGKRSYQRRWRDLHRGSPSTFPVLYAQVVLDRGEVTAVAWDSGCFDCEEEDAACTANEFEYDGSMAKDAAEQCSVADDKCGKGEGQVSELCRLAVYVSWTGTDKDGRNLLSQQNRLSRLERSQAVSLVSSLGKEAVDL